eukprot:TRINITY_DN1502_c0_g1_i2.p1 TRINITY_DN1502_c0_g1~~TRINITY_DN1502_c0_g1_i2.p1  ORF type:complete len:121 (+),score=26.39 TRINITY_DN1502_c0_g1_i2:70-432(+)
MDKTKGAKKSSSEEGGQKWKKALRRNIDWEKNDLLEVIHWVRQLVALVCGFVWGVIPITGFVGLLGFAIASALGLYMYYTKYLGVEDEVHGRFDLLSEGFLPSFALFMVTWICVYSLIHF